MRRTITISLRWIPCLLLAACDPGGGGGSSTGSTSDASTSSVGTTTATSSGTTTSTPGDTTIVPEDTGMVDTSAGPPDVPDECSVLEQDCPPGYKCMPFANDGGVSWNDSMCVPVMPDPSAPGEPCTMQESDVSGIDDCDEASMCWEVDPETLEGTCSAFCIDDGAGGLGCADRCSTCVEGADSPAALCFPGCDPITQDCPADQGCYEIEGRFECATDASPPGTMAGDPCDYINACPAGMACLTGGEVPGCAGGLGCCSPICTVGEADPCPAALPGTQCTSLFPGGALPPGLCSAGEPGACTSP